LQRTFTRLSSHAQRTVAWITSSVAWMFGRVSTYRRVRCNILILNKSATPYDMISDIPVEGPQRWTRLIRKHATGHNPETIPSTSDDALYFSDINVNLPSVSRSSNWRFEKVSESKFCLHVLSPSRYPRGQPIVHSFISWKPCYEVSLT
jgi:hypothetical protein